MMDKRTFIEELVENAVLSQGFQVSLSNGETDSRIVASELANSIHKYLDGYLLIKNSDVVK